MYNKFKCRLFVDMDGTLNCFNNHIDSIDALYKKGFFENLSPRNQVIKGLKEFIKAYPSPRTYALIPHNEMLHFRLSQTLISYFFAEHSLKSSYQEFF